MRYVLPTTPNVCSYTTLAKIVKFQRAQYKGATTVLKLGGPSAVGAEGVGCGEEVPPSHWGKVWGGGRAPSPEIFLIFFI